jgi:hypothetical protein
LLSKGAEQSSKAIVEIAINRSKYTVERHALLRVEWRLAISFRCD